jgi:hypothetical protein
MSDTPEAYYDAVCDLLTIVVDGENDETPHGDFVTLIGDYLFSEGVELEQITNRDSSWPQVIVQMHGLLQFQWGEYGEGLQEYERSLAE